MLVTVPQLKTKLRGFQSRTLLWDTLLTMETPLKPGCTDLYSWKVPLVSIMTWLQCALNYNTTEPMNELCKAHIQHFTSLPWNLSMFSNLPSYLSLFFFLNLFKSFLLMQGTIKLSNGHKHYVKGGLYCQQFEHCLLPGSADEMSGAQYFKAINLSAFLFSLITF